jgi:hemoglobin-like flavoprotein
MALQKQVLGQTISKAVELLTDLPTLVPILQGLGQRHIKYGVKAEHYGSVGQALLDTLAKMLGAAFTDAHKAAWVWVYGVISTVCRDACFFYLLHRHYRYQDFYFF